MLKETERNYQQWQLKQHVSLKHLSTGHEGHEGDEGTKHCVGSEMFRVVQGLLLACVNSPIR